MLVMAILGLIASAVMLTLPSNKQGEDSPHNAAVTLQQQLHYAREFAMVRQQPIGVTFDENGYQFLFWHDDQWASGTERGLKAQQTEWPLKWIFTGQGLNILEQNDAVKSGVFSENEDDDRVVPDVLILPSGEMTRFRVHIEHVNDPEAERWLVAENSWLISITAEKPEA